MSEFVIMETRRIRQMIFAYDIQTAIEATITLMEKLISENKGTSIEQDLHAIMPHLMGALECNDYLFFADILSFEIPTVFANNQEDC